MPLPNTTGTFRVMKEPQLRFTQNGKAALSVFVSAGSKRKGTETYDNFGATAVIFGDEAQSLAEVLQEGMYVALSGEVRDNKYTNQQGEERNTREINCTFGFIAPLPPRGGGGGQQAQQAQQDPWAGAQQAPQQAQDPFAAPQAAPPAQGQPQQAPQGQPQGYPPQQAPQQWPNQPQQGQQASQPPF